MSRREHSIRMARARVALEGLSVGDAFGERFFIALGLFDSMLRARALPSPPWAFTDDTEMALAIHEVLGAHAGIDQDALAEAFALRHHHDPHRGYGPGAHEILNRIHGGERWNVVAREAFAGAGSMGNGGAMRVAPVGAYFADDYARAAREARASAVVTHAHIEGQAGAVAVAVATAWATQQHGISDPDRRQLFRVVLNHTPPGATREGIERAASIPLDAPLEVAAGVLGNGSQVVSHDTVPFCLWVAARHLDSYEEALWSTVSVQGDRDTTCAIVGGIVAMAVGIQGIPDDWVAAREPLDLTPVLRPPLTN